MEHTNPDRPKLDAASLVNLIKDRVPKLSATARAELAVTVAVGGLCQRPDLEHGQKADILGAALRFYRMTTLTDFLKMVVTSDNGKDADLLLDRSEESIKTLRYQLSSSILMLADEQNKAAERFRTLALMLVKDKPAPETGR